MRASIRSTDYVCLPCLLREGRKRLFSSTGLLAQDIPQPPTRLSPVAISKSVRSDERSKELNDTLVRKHFSRDRRTHTERTLTPSVVQRIFPKQDAVSKRTYSSVNTDEIELSPEQLNELQIIHRLRNRLQSGLELRKNVTEGSPVGLPLEEALRSFEVSKETQKEARIIRKLEGIYPGRDISEVITDLELVSQHRRPRNRIVKAEHIKKLLDDFGVLEMERDDTTSGLTPSPSGTEGNTHGREGPVKLDCQEPVPGESAPVQAESPKEKNIAPFASEAPAPESNRTIAQLDKSRLQSIDSRNLAVRAVAVPRQTVATLSYGLRRVLFNQGVHQLQDQRTGVYNFSPYLQRIMPVSEFNFDALGEYVTSSEDTYLRQLARENKKKYIGSSSSMSGALTHFHHLLSQFRDISISTLSQSFSETQKTLTLIQKAPSAVFLRYKDGVYGVDADKEFDSANILMSLGRSLEKLLTVPQEEFEQYRKNGSGPEPGKRPPPPPEAYHYCEQGDFLLRSQLDAYDPNLPGTGMFDLKTRAVISIRMNISRHEEGVGYQIKSRFGNYESYEREYYDMIRSAFLKYTLQVRMGRMDGIFVAYHNVERIFGFQYMPLSEMDLHLHGQEDRSLGDAEFKLSIAFLNKIFDLAAARFPQKSLRFHFEARPGTDTKPAPYMYIFAEPLEEHQIEQIQDSQKAKIAEAQRRLLNPSAEALAEALAGSSDSASEQAQPTSNSDADVGFLDALSKEPVATQPQQPEPATLVSEKVQGDGPVLGLKLTIRNRLNGVEVSRPTNLKRHDDWTVEYNIDEMSTEMAGKLYRACQARRRAALAQDSLNDTSSNFYLRRLQELSRRGAEWRKQQDELEAGREVTVL